jgi:hypothetical protein
MNTTNQKTNKQEDGLGFHPGFPPGFDPRRAEKGLAQEDKSKRTCRVCGCSDMDCRQCIEKTGQPCYWVEADLCSACEPVQQKPKPKAKAVART